MIEFGATQAWAKPSLPAASPLPEIRELSFADLGQALRAGIADFRAAPRFRLSFSALRSGRLPDGLAGRGDRGLDGRSRPCWASRWSPPLRGRRAL